MSLPSLTLLIAGLLLAGVQLLAALPWLSLVDRRGFRSTFTTAKGLSSVLGGLLAAGFAFALYIGYLGESTRLQANGRYYYGGILHFQIAIDLIIGAMWAMLRLWPKGGAVALAAFRESVRQPMFWLISGLATSLIITSMVIPYFTFGEDYKMMKQLGFDTVMLAGVLFGLLSSSISIAEEIEGRTAITVMSKPISRRQFLLGKYFGILLACASMTLLLGWVLTLCLDIKSSSYFDKLDDIADGMPLEVQQLLTPALKNLTDDTQVAGFLTGVANWFGQTLAHHAGLLLSFGQVMVLLAICTSLATRMPFVINLVICAAIFMMGHLAPVLVQVTSNLVGTSSSSPLQLVNFLAQLFNAVFPALEYFDMGPAIIRDSSVPLTDFLKYLGAVFGYSVLYSAIALLGGLLLFEDKDLA